MWVCYVCEKMNKTRGDCAVGASCMKGFLGHIEKLEIWRKGLKILWSMEGDMWSILDCIWNILNVESVLVYGEGRWVKIGS